MTHLKTILTLVLITCSYHYSFSAESKFVPKEVDKCLFELPRKAVFNLKENARNPFKELVTVNSKAVKMKLKEEERQGIIKALSTWQLRAIVAGRNPICLFKRGKYKLGDVIVVKVSGREIPLKIHKVLGQPSRVVFKAGDIEITKYTNKK